MKSLNLALTVTAVCGLLVSAAPTAVCENGLISSNGGAQRMARCVLIQVSRGEESVNEKKDESNIIEPRGDDGESLFCLVIGG